MARARFLKPGFFKNESLAELRPPAETTATPAPSFAVRLLFEGLWLLADRAGRLEDRPKRIAAELFPYDVVDVAGLLEVLDQAGFIRRYGAGDGQLYISIVTFAKHQHPHVREPASTDPRAPEEKWAPVWHRASTGPAPGQPGAKTS